MGGMGMLYDQSQVYRSNEVGMGHVIGSLLSDQSQVYIFTGEREGQEMGGMLFGHARSTDLLCWKGDRR